ncbi:MAG: rRNA pseudouridine synthase [Lentisphaeria bacterium]|nr:rRNA pseudouridine synthase [Lentisphaeria bacterium]
MPQSISVPTENEQPSGGIGLSKYLSTAGVCPRRGAQLLVESGRVTVNSVRAERVSMHIFPGDKVCVDGKHVAPVTEKVYVMLHKPRGYVCTVKDRHAEKKAIDLIPLAKQYRLVSAGRLDKDSEGLILFSNDGDFIDRLTHPRYQTMKIYEVSIGDELSSADITRLTVIGIRDQGDLLRAREVTPVLPGKYRFVLTEGKNREIRRMLAALGKETRRLKRVAVGELLMRGLPVGEWKRLSPAEAQLALRSKFTGNGQKSPNRGNYPEKSSFRRG